MDKHMKSQISQMLEPISFGGSREEEEEHSREWEEMCVMDWDDQFRDSGAEMVLLGAATITGGALVTQIDSPLPGPADLVGGGIAAVGVVEIVVGSLTYGAGAIGGAVDYFFE